MLKSNEALIQHAMPVVYVAALLENLSLPLVLLMRHSTNDVGTLDAHRDSVGSVGCDWLFVRVLPVRPRRETGTALVQKRVQEQQEQHVHHQKAHDPHHEDDHNLREAIFSTVHSIYAVHSTGLHTR